MIFSTRKAYNGKDTSKFMNKFNLLTILSVAVLAFCIIINMYEISNRQLGFDDAGMSYISKEINNGKLLYSEIFDHKPPLNFYPLSIMFLFLGVKPFTTNLLAFIYSALFIIISFFIFKKLADYKSGIIGAALSAILILNYGLTNEVPMTLFGFLGIFFYILYLENGKIGNLPIAGIFIGIGAWFKQPAVIFLGAIILHQIYTYWKGQKTVLIKNILLSILGFLLSFLPLTAVFSFYLGFKNMFYSLIIFNMQFSGSASRIVSIGKLFFLLFSIFSFLIPSLFIKWEKKRELKEFLVIGILITILFFILNKEIFEQHLIQLIPFILALCILSIRYGEGKFNQILYVLLIIFFINSILVFAEGFARAEITGKPEIASELRSLIPEGSKVFSDNPVYLILSNSSTDYKIFYLAPSISSVFDLSDFCSYSKQLSYIILTHRKKYLGQENLDCIGENFVLLKKFENIGESYVEIWKKK